MYSRTQDLSALFDLGNAASGSSPLELEVVFISMPTLPTEPRPLGHHHDPIATVQRLRIGRALSARLLFDDGLYTGHIPMPKEPTTKVQTVIDMCSRKSGTTLAEIAAKLHISKAAASFLAPQRQDRPDLLQKNIAFFNR